MFKNPPKGAKFTEHKSQKQNRINFCKQSFSRLKYC